METIFEVFQVAGQRIDFSDVNFNIGLKFPLAKMLARHDGFSKEEEEEFYDCLGAQWSEITSGKQAFTCYKEENGVLKKREVEAGRIIPFPCVFILDCKCEQDVDGQGIFLRIKIEPVEKRGWVSPRFRYKVTELFFCDRSGDSLLGFLQMPFFIVELRYLSEDLSRASGGVSFDVGLVKRSVYASWIKMGMPRNCKDPIILDTGLQSEGGEVVQISLQERDGRDIPGLRSTQVACDYNVLIGGVVQELVQKDDDDVGESGGDEWLNDDVRLSIDSMRKWHEEHAEVSTQAADKVFEWVSKRAVRATALGDFRKQHAIPRPLSFWVAQFPEKLVFLPASKSPSGTACVGLSEKAIGDAAYWRTPLTTVGSSAMQRGADTATAFPSGFFKKVFQTWAKTDEAQPLIREYKSSLESAPKKLAYVLREPFWKSYVKYMADYEVMKTGSPKELLPLIGIEIIVIEKKGRLCGLPGKGPKYWSSERLESDAQISLDDSDAQALLVAKDPVEAEVYVSESEQGEVRLVSEDVACADVESAGIARESMSIHAVENADMAMATKHGNGFVCAEEQAFLSRLFDFVAKVGFQYEPRDIVRFHTCVKNGFFTLLGGASGTGKSSLALLYAKAMQGNVFVDRETFLRIDVNPGWTEPEDILGYYSVSEKRRIGGCSAFVPLLEKAMENSKGESPAYFACFEEMNLARVEEYFSDIIQQMSRTSGDRSLSLPDQDGCVKTIELDDNIRFIGTVNFDETTKEFTSRFYNRCNYIELQPTSKKADEDVSSYKVFPWDLKEVDAGALASGCATEGVSWHRLDEWTDLAKAEPLCEAVKKCICDIYSDLRKLHLDPSPRVIPALVRYIRTRPGLAEETDVQMLALDEALAQRVLPVYRRELFPNKDSVAKLMKYFEDNKLLLSYKILEPILARELPYK